MHYAVVDSPGCRDLDDPDSTKVVQQCFGLSPSSGVPKPPVNQL
jgi:hypothetical protein